MPEVCLEKSTCLVKLDYHRSDVVSCDFSLNFFLASGSSDKTVMVWKWKPGIGYIEAEYSPIAEYKYGVSTVMFLSKDSILATASYDGTISLWEIEDGTLLHTFMHESLSGVRCFCYTHYDDNSYLISAGDDSTICIWDVVKRTLVRSLKAHDETISTVSASPDGRIIFTGDTTGFSKIWHMTQLLETNNNTLQPIDTIIDCHDLGINCADFSSSVSISDGGKIYTLATCGTDNAIKMWQIIVRKVDCVSYVCNSKLLCTLNGHASAVLCVKFNPSGTVIASTSLDKTARLWKLSDGYRCVKVLNNHTRYVTTCAFSPDGTLLATGSNDKLVMVWDLTGELSINSQLLQATYSLKSSAANSPCKDKNVPKIWQKLENLGNAVNSCCFSKNDLLASGGTDKLVHLWHPSAAASNKFVEVSISPLQAHHYAINQVDFSVCGTMLASASVDGTAIIWDMTAYREMATLHGIEGGIKACRFSPDSTLLAIAGDSEIVTVYQVNSQHNIGTMSGHTDAITCLAFTYDSRFLASGCIGGHIRLWCVAPCITLCLMFMENIHDLGVTSIDFPLHNTSGNRGDTHLLATGGNDSMVKLWRVKIIDELNAKYTLLHQLQGHGGDVTCVRFPRNETRILASTATDKTVRIWDTKMGNCLYVLDSKDTMLTCCSFSADGSLLAAGGLDKSIIIWSMRTRNDNLNSSNVNGLTSSLMDETLDDDIGFGYTISSSMEKHLELLSDVPHEYVCPITQQPMIDPVLCADGSSYERNAIESWFSSGKLTSPMTNEVVSTTKLVPNLELRAKIREFLKNDKEHSNLI